MEPHFFYPAISVESVEYCKALYELLLSEQKVSKADFELKTANLGQCDSATSSPSTWPEDDSIWFEIKIQTKRCRQRPWGPSPPSPSTLHSSSSSLWPGHIIFNELRKLHNYHWDGKIWNFCLFVNSREKTVSLKFVTTESRTFDFLASRSRPKHFWARLWLWHQTCRIFEPWKIHTNVFFWVWKKIENKKLPRNFYSELSK